MSGYKRNNFILLIIAAVVLCNMGFYNHFPYVYSDTGTYIFSGFDKVLSVEKPIVYGLFVRYTSLGHSLWLVVLTQGLLVALMLHYYFNYLLSVKNKAFIFLTYVFFVAFFTGMSVCVSQLTPDVFTAIMILGIGLLVLADYIKQRDFIVISVLTVYSMIMDNPNFLVFGGLLLLLTGLLFFKKLREKVSFLRTRRVVYLWILMVAGYLSVSALNFSYGEAFSPSRGSHVYVMNRLVETGILKDYLDKNCSAKNYKICPYKDSIPWNFIWDERSPFKKTGGWEGSKPEYMAIIKDVLSDPRYLSMFIGKSVETSFVQFFSYDISDINRLKEWSWSYKAINEKFPMATREYLVSAQNREWGINFAFLNDHQKYVVAFSLLSLLILMILPLPSRTKFMILFFVAGVYLNALASGAFFGVSVRQQNRVMWLLALPVFIALADKEVRGIIRQAFTFQRKE